MTYTEVALNGVSLSLCRRCAGFVAGWLSADIAVGTRQKGQLRGRLYSGRKHGSDEPQDAVHPRHHAFGRGAEQSDGLREGTVSKHIKDKVAEKLVAGKGVGQAAEELGVHRNSVSYHKRALTTDMSDSVQEYRAAQLIELSELKAQLVSPNIPPVKKVELALAIIDREIDLLGTKAPSRSIQARIAAEVDPDQLVGYRRFVYETRGAGPERDRVCVSLCSPALAPGPDRPHSTRIL